MTSSSIRPSVAIAFHSGYGHTAVLAEAVARSAASAADRLWALSENLTR